MAKEIKTDIPLNKAEFCVVDVETTGMSSAFCRIIEIGIVKIRELKIVESYSTFLNPGCEIPYFITELTGISNSDVYDAPYFEEVAEKVKEYIGKSVLTGHNLQFDLSFLKKAFSIYNEEEKIENPLLCTLRLSRKIYSMLPSKSLGAVAKHLNIKHLNKHRALGDATATARILIKMIKELQENFNIKTVAELVNFQSVPEIKTEAKHIKKKLLSDYSKAPDTPGVYYFFNSKNEIIYVGKAKSLRSRLRNYFSTGSEGKYVKIVSQASKLNFERTNSELTALLAESELIKIHNPKHNVLLKKYGKSYFIKVNKEHQFPVLEFSGKFDFDGNDYFGPYTNRETIKSLLKIVSSTFRLRECKEREFNSHRECYLTQIDRCVAPCIFNDSKIYFDELERVYEFLCGKNQLALQRLIERMKLFSERQKFEEAASIRDMINLVLSQIHKSSIINEPINTANVLIEANTSGKKDYVLLISGKIFIKEYIVHDKDFFEEALDDYFNGTINIQEQIAKSDLDKIKIILNWITKNRNFVRLFYLKDFQSKKELMELTSSYNHKKYISVKSKLNIKTIV